ncbi:MAG: hypothetical protein JSV44_03990 [Candidatus Zixiibacteriota bacterium]|nr:MAG: hypothetical protein JSV44_03990 [candidate division Zixibacteria bacterium]
MNRIPAYLVVLAVLMACQPSSAQDDSVTCSQFRVILNSGERIEGRNGILTSISLTGVSNKGRSIDIPRSEIWVIYRCSGSKAGKGALMGAGMGLITGIIAIIQLQADPEQEIDESKIAPGFLVLTGGAALIGMAIGSAFPTWERIPLETSIQFNPQRKMGTLAITVSF